MRTRIGSLPAWIYLIALILAGSLWRWVPVQGILLAGGAVGLIALLAATFSQIGQLKVWIILCMLAVVGGAGLIALDSSAGASCLASYEGQPRAIGQELRPEAKEYRRRNPSLTNEELLFDAAGIAERVWTAESIEKCRRLLNIVPLAWPTSLVVFLLSALNALGVRRKGLLSLPSRDIKLTDGGPAVPTAPSIYDAFISYRHQEPDRTVALELVQRLEENGFRIAIDERDFKPNCHFLTEMERCIKQSRFTLCILSRSYLQSGACEEEAVITKVLDISDRKRRLVPIFAEPGELPVWLYGLVGINFYRPDPAIDPFEKLLTLLRQPST